MRGSEESARIAGSEWIALVAAVLGGAMIGVQGRINGELAGRTHSAVEAAAASFIVGLGMLALAVPFRRDGLARLRGAVARGQVSWWWWFSGFGGAFLVATSAHAVPKIGVALVSVCLVAGTTTGALLTDQFGVGPSGHHPPSFWRIAGVVTVIAAVVISSIGAEHGALRPALVIVLFAAGASTAFQQAANGRLREAADDVVVASFVSFLGGSTILVLVLLLAEGHDLHAPPSAPWLYLGGPLGLVYILIGASMVKVLGVLRFVLGVVAGQLLAAVVMDLAWPEPGTSLRAATVVGAFVTVAGVWLSGLGDTEGRVVADE